MSCAKEETSRRVFVTSRQRCGGGFPLILSETLRKIGASTIRRPPTIS
jgi:hypothetical protein